MVKVIIVGSGFMGQTHGAAYKNMEQVQVVAICDKNVEKGVKFSEEFFCTYYESCEAALEKEDIDVVDICLPTFLHEKYVLLAAYYKKHIFCEKPVTLSLESLDRMISAAEVAGVEFYVGQVVRFWPEYQEAKKMYTDRLDEIKSVYCARLSEHPKWSDWYKQVDSSGGGLFDLHLHDIDYLCYLLGKVKSVYAVGKKNTYECWNHVTSILNFENGISATVEGIIDMAVGYPFTMVLRLVSENQVFDFEMKAGSNLENVADAKRNTYLYINTGESKKLEIEMKNAYQIELKHFISCINEGKKSDIISTESVRNVMCTILAIQKSLETHQEVMVDYKGVGVIETRI